MDPETLYGDLEAVRAVVEENAARLEQLENEELGKSTCRSVARTAVSWSQDDLMVPSRSEYLYVIPAITRQLPCARRTRSCGVGSASSKQRGACGRSSARSWLATSARCSRQRQRRRSGARVMCSGCRPSSRSCRHGETGVEARVMRNRDPRRTRRFRTAADICEIALAMPV
jgi:hypothetical protein